MSRRGPSSSTSRISSASTGCTRARVLARPPRLRLVRSNDPRVLDGAPSGRLGAMASRGGAPVGRLEPVELPARTLTAVLAVARPELSVIVLCYQANEAIRRVINPLYHQLEASGVA